jgi:hypothetical protein
MARIEDSRSRVLSYLDREVGASLEDVPDGGGRAGGPRPVRAAAVVRALVPTAVAAALLSQEFPTASLDTDGTLSTVMIYGLSYSEALSRIRDWMNRTHVGPVLVTDGESAEDLLGGRRKTRPRNRPGRIRTPGGVGRQVVTSGSAESEVTIGFGSV